MSKFTDWKKKAIGRHIDVDHAYGAQCVDVALDYAQYCFPGHSWRELLGYGNAKDLFKASNPKYWSKVVNNPNNAKQVPPQGSVIIYNAFRGNPYGHIAVVDSSNARGVNVIEQNGFNPGGKAFEVFRTYGQLPIIGWLVPKFPKPKPTVKKPIPKPAPKPPVVVKPPVTPASAPLPVPQPETKPIAPVPAIDYSKETYGIVQQILTIVQNIWNKLIGK